MLLCFARRLRRLQLLLGRRAHGLRATCECACDLLLSGSVVRGVCGGFCASCFCSGSRLRGTRWAVRLFCLWPWLLRLLCLSLGLCLLSLRLRSLGLWLGLSLRLSSRLRSLGRLRCLCCVGRLALGLLVLTGIRLLRVLLCRRILRLSLGLGCGNTSCGGASCCGACLRGALFRRLWLSALLRGIGLGARVRLSALLSLWLLSLWSLCVLWLWRDRRLLRLCYLLLRYRRINQAWLLFAVGVLARSLCCIRTIFFGFFGVLGSFDGGSALLGRLISRGLGRL